MALDLSSTARTGNGASASVTLNATGTDAVEVILPTWCRAVDARGEDSAGADADFLFARTGTDGAAQAADAVKIDAGAMYRIFVSAGRSRALVASDRTLYVSGESSGTIRLHLLAGV